MMTMKMKTFGGEVGDSKPKLDLMEYGGSKVKRRRSLGVTRFQLGISWRKTSTLIKTEAFFPKDMNHLPLKPNP